MKTAFQWFSRFNSMVVEVRFYHNISNIFQATKNRVSLEQRDVMLRFMKNHPALGTNKFTAPDGVKHKARLLNELTEQLNSCPSGATKASDKWLKVMTALDNCILIIESEYFNRILGSVFSHGKIGALMLKAKRPRSSVMQTAQEEAQR